MIQTDLLDWLNKKRVIKAAPPSQGIQQRAFVLDQLAPIMRELEALELSPLAISEALHQHAAYFQDKAQNQILISNHSDKHSIGS